jgi:AraC-like DNA-binding protein
MKQIMSKIGMHDKGQFAKDFKKIYGVNPAQYRHRYNSELKSLKAAKSSTK